MNNTGRSNALFTFKISALDYSSLQAAHHITTKCFQQYCNDIGGGGVYIKNTKNKLHKIMHISNVNYQQSLSTSVHGESAHELQVDWTTHGWFVHSKYNYLNVTLKLLFS